MTIERALRIGTELRNLWLNATPSDCEPLTFGELNVGDKFIGIPVPGDNNGHGGLRGGYHLFCKTESARSTYFPLGERNAVKLLNNNPYYFTRDAQILKVIY